MPLDWKFTMGHYLLKEPSQPNGNITEIIHAASQAAKSLPFDLQIKPADLGNWGFTDNHIGSQCKLKCSTHGLEVRMCTHFFPDTSQD